MPNKPKEELPSSIRPFAAKMAKSYGGRFIITDKGTKRTYYGTINPDGSVTSSSYEVLTGKNDNPNSGKKPVMDLSMDVLDAQEKKGDYSNLYTPLGDFTGEKANVYGSPGIDLNSGIANTKLAIHTTYPGELAKRTKLYGNNNLNDNNASYGCINGKCGDVTKMVEFFKKGDHVAIIDTRLSQKENMGLLNTNKYYKHDNPIAPKPTLPKPTLPNPEVVKKQQQLISAGYDIKPDGIWGAKSKLAQEQYNNKNNPVIENNKPDKIDLGQPYTPNFNQPQKFDDISLNSKTSLYNFSLPELPSYTFQNTISNRTPQENSLIENRPVDIQSKNPNIWYNAEEAANIPHSLPFSPIPFPSNSYNKSPDNTSLSSISQPQVDGRKNMFGSNLLPEASSQRIKNYIGSLPNNLPQPDGSRNMSNQVKTQNQNFDRRNLEKSVAFNPNDYPIDPNELLNNPPISPNAVTPSTSTSPNAVTPSTSTYQPQKLEYNPDGSMKLNNNWNGLDKSQQVPFITPKINTIEGTPNQGNTNFVNDPSNPSDATQTKTPSFNTKYNPYEGIVNVFDFALNAAASLKNKQTQKDNFQPQQPDTSYFNQRALRGDKVMYAQDGGEPQDKTPIYVTDKNDPRLKAYSDSVNVYKGGLLDVSKMRKATKTADNVNNGTEPNLEFFNSFDNLNKLNKKDPTPTTVYHKTFSDGTSYQGYLYKEPVQPIVYQKPKPSPTVSPIYKKPIGSTEFREGKKPVQPVVYQNPQNLNTPELWEKSIRDVELNIGNPDKWTMNGYNQLQQKLNDYKKWRETTPEGKAVVDYHNEPNEYVVKLPKHLQPVDVTPSTTPIGNINIHGRNVPYYSEDHKQKLLTTFAPYKPTQVGTSTNYIVSKFQEKTKGWDTKGNLLDEKGLPITLPTFKQGGQMKKLCKYKKGGEYSLSDSEITKLKKMGYEFELINI